LLSRAVASRCRRHALGRSYDGFEGQFGT
jgi:hypothetical protein